MKKIHVNAINRKLSDQAAFVEESDRKYEASLREQAEKIADMKNEKPIILLSGPSGAGKTTSALKIDEMLDNMGIHTHTISMDDYFLPAGKFAEAIGEDGQPDYESPYRIDIKKLNEHMELIYACKEVIVPSFEFATQSVTDGFAFKRGEDDIVVFEGIHALNPIVTGTAGDFAHCMYVSVRSRVELNDGTLVHPSLIRLMRRILRDGSYRGRSEAETLDMFDSVEDGENKYIMPFKHRAECSIDTFIPYEVSVYKQFLLDRLEKVSREYKDFSRFMPMLELLRQADGIDIENIPENSLVREFIGGSCYEY